MRSAIYVRISDDREGKALGVARQERDCRALCEAAGWDVVAVLSDNDVSAYRNVRRPGYESLLTGLRDGSWDVVVAWHPDRLHRSPIELETFIDVIEQAKVKVATVEAGNYDLSTPTGRMTARVVGAVARHESEHKASRLRSKHAELARAGKSAGGGKAFGFEPDRVTIRESEAALIREAAQAVLDGASLRAVCRSWEKAGAVTQKGGPWSVTVVRRILMSARIAGVREHDGQTFEAEWPAIVDYQTVLRLRSILTDPSRNKRHRVRKYLLTGGLAICGECRRPLVARPKDGGARCYVCSTGNGFTGCGKIRRLAEPLEEDVAGRLIRYLERLPDSIEPEAPNLAPLFAEVERLEDAVALLAEDYYAHNLISREQFLAASDAQQAALKVARENLALADVTVRDRRADLAKLRDPDLDHDQKRAIVATWVDRVVVNRAVKGRNFYDASRVLVDWR